MRARLLLIVLGALLSLSRAGEPAALPAPDVDALIRGLHDRDQATRSLTSRRLAERGAPAIPDPG